MKRVFDIHAHIYPDAIASHAVRAISEAYDGVPIQNDGRLDTLEAIVKKHSREIAELKKAQ